MINEHKLAVDIAKIEGGKKQVCIGQIKEILKITLALLSKEKPSAVLALLEKRK